MNKEKNLEEGHDSSVRALDKAIYVIEFLSGIDGDIDLAGLSRKVKMPKSTLLRLLRTMKNHNLVRQDKSTKRFSLGLGLIALGKAAEKLYNLAGEIHPYLIEITEKTGETASLMIREGRHAVYIDQVVSNNMIHGSAKIGFSLDLYCSSGGKALLSGFDDEKIDSLFKDKEFEAKTAKTITDLKKLKKEIQKVREQGYAVDDEEVEIGGRCVAAPVKDKDGQIIAAVSVMGPTLRISQKNIPDIAQIVMSVVKKASYALGYKDN